MIPGYSRIYSCPYCGKKKEIATIASGNTFGARRWSDCRMDAPMMPVVSFVQKCNKCGKYYLPSRLEYRETDDMWDGEYGNLSYPELIEAYRQLLSEGFRNIGEEMNVKVMLFQGYNDYFYRYKVFFRFADTIEERIPSAEDVQLHKEIGLWLIENWIKDDDMLLKAEYYREIGDMENARKTIAMAQPTDDFLKKFATEILLRIDNGDTEVFELERIRLKRK